LPRAVKPPSQGGWTCYTTSDCQGAVRPPQETGPTLNCSKIAQTN
jgi:hypothetical protein